MTDVEQLNELTPEQYLQRFHIDFYLQDLIRLFLSRGRGDSRSASEFIGQYFDSVLRGEHVLHRDFSYINSTAFNRRAFVSLWRRSLSGIDSPASVALTQYDFHDLILQLCGDFPLRIVENATHYAQKADPSQHHLLGESKPFGESSDSASSCLAPGQTLYVFESLQRTSEFCFVYTELLGVVKFIFTASQSKLSLLGDLSGEGGVARSVLLMELECRVRNGTLDGAALPSERALLQLLNSNTSRSDGSSSRKSVVALDDVIKEMVEHFEVVNEPFSEELNSTAVGMLQKELNSTAVGMLQKEEGMNDESQDLAPSKCSIADRRRREKKSRSSFR